MPPGAKFCPSCATPMALQQSGQAVQTPSPPPASEMSRPRGKTIIMLIDFIVGIVVTVEGVHGLVSPVGQGLSASLVYAVGATYVIIGLLSVAVGYGLWKVRPWAWPLGLWAGMVYLVLGVVFAVPLILLVGIVSLVFYYYNRTSLKRYLGKVKP